MLTCKAFVFAVEASNNALTVVVAVAGHRVFSGLQILMEVSADVGKFCGLLAGNSMALLGRDLAIIDLVKCFLERMDFDVQYVLHLF